MIDFETFKQQRDAAEAAGVTLSSSFAGLYDRRSLVPLAFIPVIVEGETGLTTTETVLREKAAAGWFKIETADGVEGAPMFVCNRIGRFFKLESQGYGSAELAAFGSYEDEIVDAILDDNDLSYIDDDLDLLIEHTKSAIEVLEPVYPQGFVLPFTPQPLSSEQLKRLEQHKRELPFFQRIKNGLVPSVSTREKIEWHAHNVRMFNEWTRLQLFLPDVAKVEAGYSPWCSFESLAFELGPDLADAIQPGPIDWGPTIRSTLVHQGSLATPVPLRLPNFLIVDGKVTTTKTMTPAAYASAWKDENLDGFLREWARQRGERLCLNESCRAPLPTDAHNKKLFCDDKCRAAERSRRHRKNNPLSVEKTQKKYWGSVELPESKE